MQTKIRNCCTNTNIVIARYNCSSVNSSIITTMNGSRLKITRIFVCKYKYLSVAFAKILIGMKMVDKHKTRKNHFISVTCATIQSRSLCTARKAAKGVKLIMNAVNGQRLANKYGSQIQGQTNFRSTFVMIK